MGYTHYGKQAEVWKHLPLCDLIAIEQPSVYVETNSAYAEYNLQATPEQCYGIYHFLEKATTHAVNDSLYSRLERAALAENRYIGSPGLAMAILGEKSHYIFFDIDADALRSIEEFGKKHELSDRIELHHRDSIAGMRELLPRLPLSSFIHIDPYRIDTPDENGYTYLDVFEQAVRLHLKCFLWYGYQTLQEKEALEGLIKSRCREMDGVVFSCHALTLSLIEWEKMPCAPGVLGSGLLTGNLSDASWQHIAAAAGLLTDFYRDAKYREFTGELYAEEVM